MSTPSLIPAITTTSENAHTIGTASTTVNTTASQNANTMHHISSVSSVIPATTSVSSMTQSWKGMLKYKIGGTVFITF